MNAHLALRGLLTLLVAGVFVSSPQVAHADAGKDIYTKICAACHTVGGGKRVGPDLKGVSERRDEAWLISFIKSSQAMVNSGDATAVKLFEEYNKVPMPDTAASEADIKAVLAYIKKLEAGGGDAAATDEAAAPVFVSTPEDVAAGRELFQGTVRLENGGPACNSCHNVDGDAVFGGGALARDLTKVFSRMGAAGVGAMLSTPPQIMEQAYRGTPVTPDEIRQLTGFLQEVDKSEAQPRDYGIMLLGGGVGGVIVLMLLYGVFWGRRKKRSVNQDIYDRQIRSI
jgi:mono/diheme cytochrome c family protein